MTVAILSPPRTSTSGRAPVFSMIIRFWIRVDSLKRPPTLLTIPSSFSSSSTAISSAERADDQVAHLGDRDLQVVVDDQVLVLPDVFRLAVSRGHPPGDGGLVLRAPPPQALLVHRGRGCTQEDRDGLGVEPADLPGPLRVDVQDDPAAPGAVVLHLPAGGPVQVP